MPGLFEPPVGGAEEESSDDDSNILSLLPREPDPAGGGGRDIELGLGENDGGAAGFEGPPVAMGGAMLVYTEPAIKICEINP